MCNHNVNFYNGEWEQLYPTKSRCCVGNGIGTYMLCFYVWCGILNWVWFGQLEQVMTQRQVQPEATSSASTSEHCEEQVCKDCYELVT
jgi:hypothetical protein